VRIGALVLVTGAGFFYAYAIERGWISEAQRAIMGAIAGLAVIGLGIAFNRRGFAPLAQGFVGCGSGLLFLDAFASHRFYDLLSAPAALVAMAAVTGLTVAIALRWSAMPLVILAQLGGYLTPLLLDERMPDRALVVFAYVFVIDAGFLLVAGLRRWTVVQILAAAATPVLFLIASNVDPSPSPVQVAAWACAFDALFLAMAVIPAVIRREILSPVSWVVVFAMALGAALVAEDAIGATHADGLAVTLGGLALVHAAFAETMNRRVPLDLEGREVVRACAAAFLLDAVRFPFEARGTTIAFAAAGAALALAARLRGSIAFRAIAAAAFGVAVARVIGLHIHGAMTLDVAPFLNADFWIGMSVAGALALASLADRGTRWIGLSAASLLAVAAITGEIVSMIAAGIEEAAYRAALVQVARTVSMTGVMVGFAVAAARTGRWLLVAITGVHAVLALAGFERLIWVLQRPPQPLVLNPVCLGSLLVPLGMLAAGRIVRQARPVLLGPVLMASGSVLPLVALSFEAFRFFRHHFGATGVVDAGSAAVSVTWALYAGALLAIGISKRLRAIRLGALALLGLTLIKVAVNDLSQLDRLARIASFIALGIVLMTGAWAYHRFAGRISDRNEPGGPGGAGDRA
jgi:uncharacterized membrane protein